MIPDTESAETETVKLKPEYEVRTTSDNFTSELASVLSCEIPAEAKIEIAKFVAEVASNSVVGLSRRVSSFTDVRTDEQSKLLTNEIVRQTEIRFPGLTIDSSEIRKAAEKAIEYCVEALTGTIIPIPELVINPQSISVYRFDEFDLDTTNLRLRPADETIIGRELSEGGRTIEFEGDDIELITKSKKDTPENEVAKYIIVKDNIDYGKCSKLIFSLIDQAKKHFLSYLSVEDTTKVMSQQARTIADYIYAQMNEHFHESDVAYTATEIRPFSRIEGSFGSKVKADDIYDYNVTVQAGELRQKVFKGFGKACHTLYKFDSLPELNFARILEQDSDVKKWLRPAPKQFNIYWGKFRLNYEPDFIVETTNKIYMIEVKAGNEINTPDVQEKTKAAAEYCRMVSEWNEINNGKLWEYAIVADSNIKLNSSFKYLVDTCSPIAIFADDQTTQTS